jgi:hypothetical protein
MFSPHSNQVEVSKIAVHSVSVCSGRSIAVLLGRKDGIPDAR